MKQLHNLLANVVPTINKELNAINSGGCGHFAYQLHMALAARDISSSIVLVNHCYTADSVSRMISRCNAKDINRAWRMIMDTNSSNDPCLGHVCLVVDRVLYDSQGMSHKHAISDAIEAPVMKAMLYTDDQWNPTFADHNGGDMEEIVPKFKCFFDAMLAALPVVNEVCDV